MYFLKKTIRNIIKINTFAYISIKSQMSKIKNFLQKVIQIKGLKYIVATIIAIVIIGFVDQNSILSHIQNMDKINQLNEEIEVYEQKYEKDQAQLMEMNTSPKAVEKMARERYFMKKDDEDIFVLSDNNSGHDKQ